MKLLPRMKCCLKLLAVLAAGCCPPVPGADSASPASGRDVTFVVTSDVHYDAFENEDRNERVRDTLRAMNEVTNLTWPEVLGGGPDRRNREACWCSAM